MEHYRVVAFVGVMPMKHPVRCLTVYLHIAHPQRTVNLYLGIEEVGTVVAVLHTGMDYLYRLSIGRL